MTENFLRMNMFFRICKFRCYCCYTNAQIGTEQNLLKMKMKIIIITTRKTNDFNLVNVFVFDLTSTNFGSSKGSEIKNSTQISSFLFLFFPISFVLFSVTHYLFLPTSSYCKTTRVIPLTLFFIT